VFKIWSHDFKHENKIPPYFTKDGPNVNPHLAWEGVPEGTKSFALIVDDPDAPRGIWTHWLVEDIPGDTHSIPQNSVPAGASQIANDFGVEEYRGPSPPSGIHRYFFKVYAIDREHLKAKNKKKFYKLVKKHSLAEAEIMGYYQSR
jgi:Raf kinase inhibitor-like YbhB/YbcL family protein